MWTAGLVPAEGAGASPLPPADAGAVGSVAGGALAATALGTADIDVANRPVRGWRVAAKRGMDLGGAAVLLLLLAPLLLVALAVRLDSPGPVLFRQVRIGHGERPFAILKFCTMRWTAGDGPGTACIQAVRGDPRVTRVGRTLRAWSLDELPQLLNVLRGEMSLVGPRPHALAHHRHYVQRIPGYRLRHRVKPGLTGLAQVRGLRGATETDAKMAARVAADLDYIDRWSLRLDLRLLLATVAIVLRRTEAY